MFSKRVFSNQQAIQDQWRRQRPHLGKVVFTNGCFDILHAGHVQYLTEAKSLGDFLVLGLNGDASISRLKGPKRPLVPFDNRAAVLAGLRAVDLVVGFEQDTPYQLIKALEPDVLVKGGDWRVEEIVGSDLVLARGGEVISAAFKNGVSTTDIVQTILERYQT